MDENTRRKSWNKAIEQTVRFIGDSARGYKLMHLTSSYRYNKLHEIILYITIVFSPIAGILAAIELAMTNAGTISPGVSMTIGITIAILSYCSGILSSVVKFGKFSEKSDAHKIAASKYTSLESNIRRQLILFRKDRENGNSYLQWISKAAEDLYSASPYISSGIYNDYCKKAKEKGIGIPDQYDKIIDLEEGYADNAVTSMVSSAPLIINNDRGDDNNENDGNNNGGDDGGDDGDNNVGNKEQIHRRNDAYTPVPDLNMYDDIRMKYEIKRFMGLQ